MNDVFNEIFSETRIHKNNNLYFLENIYNQHKSIFKIFIFFNNY